MFNVFNRINLATGGGSVGSNGFVTDTIGDFFGGLGIGPGEPFNSSLLRKLFSNERLPDFSHTVKVGFRQNLSDFSKPGQFATAPHSRKAN
jgi:hypothetical protein